MGRRDVVRRVFGVAVLAVADALTLLLIALLLWRLWQMGRCGVESGDPGCVDPDRQDRDANFWERVT